MQQWQMIPEIVGCNASLRMAVNQAVDAVDQDRHFVVEGEAGTGRRLLARSAWCRRSPGSRSLFTLDCRIVGENAELMLFGGRESGENQALIQPGRHNLSRGILLLHAESLPYKTQARLAQVLEQQLCRRAGDGMLLMLTCAPAHEEPGGLHSELATMLLRVRVPALRERLEDLRLIAETFLRDASPFERVRCSQALIERFCTYDWPGNIIELRSVLRRLLLQEHHGLLDVRHLAGLVHRDESCFALLHGSSVPLAGFPAAAPAESRRVQ